MEPTPGEDAVKTAEMTTEVLEYYLKRVDKAAVGFERSDFSTERSSTLGKMPSNSIACHRDIISERKSRSMWQTSFLSYLKKLPQQPPSPQVSSHQY